MKAREIVSHPFFRATKAQWMSLGLLVLMGIGGVLLFGAVERYFGADGRFVLMLVLAAAVTALEPWSRERQAAHTGANSPFAQLRGRQGVVKTACNPKGTVWLDGAFWHALSIDGAEIIQGERVFVHGGDGLVLKVSRTPP